MRGALTTEQPTNKDRHRTQVLSAPPGRDSARAVSSMPSGASRRIGGTLPGAFIVIFTG